MKRLITILFFSIVGMGLCGLQAQEKVPMTVFGDVYIDSEGIMKSQGPMYLTAESANTNAKVVNNGKLEMDTVFFYTNRYADGLLLHGDKSGNTITSVGVSVRQKIAAWDYYMVSFPFDVDLTTGVRTKEGLNLYQGLNAWFRVQYYNAAKRASEGKKQTGNDVDIWENLPAGVTTLTKGNGYRIAVHAGGVHDILDADTTGYAAGNFHIDFYAKSQQDINGLFNSGEKGINLRFDSIPPDKWYDDFDHSEGWNAIGGLHSANFILSNELYISGSSTVLNEGKAIYVWEDTNGWREFDPDFLSIGVLRPYAVFFLQTSRAMRDKGLLSYASGKPMNEKGGFVFLENVTPDYRTLHYDDLPVFRAVEQSNSPDKLVLSLTSEKSNLTSSANFKFSETGSRFFNTYSGADKGLSIALNVNHHYIWTSAMIESSGKYTAAYTKSLPVGESEVKLGVATSSQGGYYTFSLTSLKSETIKSAVLLDKVAKIETDLLKDTYRFNSGSSRMETDDRFVLYINKVNTSIDPAPTTDQDIYAYVNNNILTVKNLTTGDKIQVVDLLGRTIALGVASGDTFSATLKQKGVYIVIANGARILKVLNK